MRCTLAVLIALFVGAMIDFHISFVHPGEGEVTGQYSSHMEFGEVTATFSASQSLYDVSGVYVVSHSAPTNTQIIFDWSAKGQYNERTKATNETFDLYNRSTRTKAASFTSTMLCNRDPWREATAAPCQAVVTTSTGSPAPGAFPSDLPASAMSIPFSARLSKTQRAELNRQHKIFMAGHDKPGDPPIVHMTESTAPTIVSPTANGYVVYKKSKFVIKPRAKI